MAYTHEEQLSQLEHALANTSVPIVRDAIQAQIDTLSKKIVAKKGRKAKLGDGTKAGVGDTIYSYEVPRIEVDNSVYAQTKERIYAGKIQQHSVFAINAMGNEVATQDKQYNSRFIYRTSAKFYRTPEDAHHAMIAEVERRIISAKANVEKAQAEVGRAIRALGLAQEDDFGKSQQTQSGLSGSRVQSNG